MNKIIINQTQIELSIQIHCNKISKGLWSFTELISSWEFLGNIFWFLGDKDSFIGRSACVWALIALAAVCITAPAILAPIINPAFWTGGRELLATALATPPATVPTHAPKPTLEPRVDIPLATSVPAYLSNTTLPFIVISLSLTTSLISSKLILTSYNKL
jgi:hypothetical protein